MKNPAHRRTQRARPGLTALISVAGLTAGCQGADLECFACLDTFIVYVEGESEGDWLGDGYRLEVETEDVVYKCNTGTTARIGKGAKRCGKQDDAPLVSVREDEGEPIVRIGFWETTPSEVRVTLRNGDDVLVHGDYEPVYEEVPAGLGCPVCMRAESERLPVVDEGGAR